MNRLAIATMVLLIGSPVIAATLRVPSKYPTIQAAIDSASVGDSVIVAEGVYSGEENKNLTFRGKELLLMSERGALHTSIDCEGDGRGLIFVGGEGPEMRVEGFTIWESKPQGENGGGILCESGSSPTISWCLVARSGADAGSGMYISDSSPTIINCTFGDCWSNSGAAVIRCAGKSSVSLIRSHIGGVDEPAFVVVDEGSSLILECCALDPSLVSGEGEIVFDAIQPNFCDFCWNLPTILDVWPDMFAPHVDMGCEAPLSPCGQLIGVFEPMCVPYPVQQTTWGWIKSVLPVESQ
jgi:hypothetical protein